MTDEAFRSVWLAIPWPVVRPTCFPMPWPNKPWLLPFPFVVVWRSRTHGLLRQNATTSRQNFVPPKILVGVVGTPSRLSGHYAKQGIFHQICQWYHQRNQYLDCDGHAKTTGNSHRSRKNGRFSRMGTIVRRRTRHCDESIGGQ
jgi:hypothetical protein